MSKPKGNWDELPNRRGGERRSCTLAAWKSGRTIVLCPDALRILNHATGVRRYIDVERKLVALRPEEPTEDNTEGLMRVWNAGRGTTGNVSAGTIEAHLGLARSPADTTVELPHYEEDGMLVLDLSGLPRADAK